MYVWLKYFLIEEKVNIFEKNLRVVNILLFYRVYTL